MSPLLVLILAVLATTYAGPIVRLAAAPALARFSVPADNPRLRTRYDFLKVDAFIAAGQSDSARATLERLAAQFPDNPRIKDRLAQMQGK